MKVNDKVLIQSLDGYGGRFGIIKSIQDKASFNIGVSIEGVQSLVWFSKTELIKADFKVN